MRLIDEQRLQQNLALIGELERLPASSFSDAELADIQRLLSETDILLRAAARQHVTRKSQTPASADRECRFVMGGDGVWRWQCDGALVTEKDQLSWLMD